MPRGQKEETKINKLNSGCFFEELHQVWYEVIRGSGGGITLHWHSSGITDELWGGRERERRDKVRENRRKGKGEGG